MQKISRIRAIYPNFFGDNLIAYVALRILMYFNGPGILSDVTGICSDSSVLDFKKKKPRTFLPDGGKPLRRRIYRDSIPPGIIWSLARRVFKNKALSAFSEFVFFSSLKRGDIVYVWPSASVSLYKRLKKHGYLIVSERINTLLTTSKQILDKEYASLGLPTENHGLTAADVEAELTCMNLSDFIFSPSPGVTESILSAGIPGSKILESSYGLRATEILPVRRDREEISGAPVTAIFVGSVCIRKGIHLLLEAWSRSGVAARLVIVGRIFPDVAETVKDAMAKNPGIIHYDFMEDLKPIYASADFFVLPSLEEGSPLVTYLALGASLPLLVSPMGAGGVVEDGKEGILIDPHDIDEFARALTALVSDADLRHRMSVASGAKASEYTWDKVAMRRLEVLKAASPNSFSLEG